MLHKLKVKIKLTRVQAPRFCTGRTAHRGSRGIALPFHYHGTRRGEGSASRPDRSLAPRKTRYPMYRRLGRLQGRSGQVRKISPPPGFDPPTVQPITSRYTDYATLPTMLHKNSIIRVSKSYSGTCDRIPRKRDRPIPRLVRPPDNTNTETGRHISMSRTGF